MPDFFKVTTLADVLEMTGMFPPVGTETVTLAESGGRILAEELTADHDLPDFLRSTMDGYAVKALATFGASEGSPACLNVKGSVSMGRPAGFSIAPGETARISTGGMLPEGADSVVMIEHTEMLDETTIEVYRSVAPGQNVIETGEDFSAGQTILTAGQVLRPQETGLLAAFGRQSVTVYKRPRVAIISTGDEIVPIAGTPVAGQIRDVNSYSLSGQVLAAGGLPLRCGIVGDNFEALNSACRDALAAADMVLLSGGSSVGVRDFTVDVLRHLPDSRLLVHGISISPGKPTLLARAQHKAVWGLPGHVVSAMVVFKIVVYPFFTRVAGADGRRRPAFRIPARLSRNLGSAQGRTDFVRVRLTLENSQYRAEPILGKSGLLNTMVMADGLIEIDVNTEGLEAGTEVAVIPL